MKDLVVLVDQDEVLADLLEGWIRKVGETFPELPIIPREKVTDYYMETLYPAEYKTEIEDMLAQQYFFLNLKPVPGSIEAIKEMDKLADVFICTTPYGKNKYCAQEKFDWVDKHLGRDKNGNTWTKKLILTGDKTLVRGDYLIDDKPIITGSMTPTWEQIVFDMPYNRHITDKKRIIEWTNWKEVLGL